MEYDSSIKFGKENFVNKFKGAFLENYKILNLIGKVAYGKVYRVLNLKTGEIRACMHLSELSKENLEKFQSEINFLIKADHPNIIRLYEIFESQSSLYLIMEECIGGNAFDRILENIQSKRMYIEVEAANIFQQIMSAIEYCHNHGIVHKILLPENLLYLNSGSEKDNSIKVIDFGFSPAIPIDKKIKSRITFEYYVSPEIIKGIYTEKCDIWSEGIILYIFLSGIPPFNGLHNEAIFNQISQMKFSFPEEQWGNISEDEKDLIRHIIAPENERYNAKQVLDHPWFNNIRNINIANLDFNPIFLKEYAKSSLIKKISLLFIASRIDENEIKDLKQIFEAFDKNKDGQISYQELKWGLYEIFENIDLDKNGKINYTEFLAATLQKKSYFKKEILYEAFCLFDKDRKGSINKDKLMQVLKLEKNQEEEAENYITIADKDGDGVINFKEFLEIMGYDDK